MITVAKRLVLRKSAAAERNSGPAGQVEFFSLGVFDYEISGNLQRAIAIDNYYSRFVHSSHLPTILIPEASVHGLVDDYPITRKPGPAPTL